MRRLLLTTGLLLAAATAVPGPATAAACSWTASSLPLPLGTEAGEVAAADGDGWLAGSAGDPAGFVTQGVLWRHGTAYPLGQAFGMSTRVSGVTQAGVVVGQAYDDAGYAHAVRYRNNQWERLAEAGYVWTVASDVNLRGDAVGYQLKSDLLSGRFVVWSVDGATPVRELTLPSTDESPQAVFLDDDGTAAGYTVEFDPGNGAHILRGYVWAPDGTRTSLRVPYDPEWAQVAGFFHGRVLGNADREDGITGAAEWNVRGEFVRFFSGGTVRGANRFGVTLGSISMYGDDPVVWQPDGKVEPLPAPAGSRLVRANAINDEQVGGQVDGLPAVWTRSC